ncbi:MAG: cyclic nucleotide-binding domain-containing protein [Leptospirales bacterium]|jgi:CRP-like cAMP-binding protein/TolA-binding protein
MPKARNYNGGSIVYFQGDTGSDVYVLQKGRVSLISTALESGEEIKEEVKLGEFFGVKSTLGNYPREETAQVYGNTSVIVFSSQEFEQYCLKNTRLIMTMLRVFSKQLRDVHRAVREILKADEARNPAFELLNTGESFYRNGNIDHALYALDKYLSYNPNGRNVSRAQELIQMAKKGLTYPINFSSPAPEDDPGASQNNSDGVTRGLMAADQALDDPFALNVAAPAAAASGKPAAKSIAQLFEQGREFLQNQEFEKALDAFQECVGFSHLKNDAEQTVFAQAHYELGFAQLKAGQLEQASASFSNYIKKFPTGEHVKESIYQLGVTAEATGNQDRAKTLYHKVATMPPPDDITRTARARLEKLG